MKIGTTMTLPAALSAALLLSTVPVLAQGMMGRPGIGPGVNQATPQPQAGNQQGVQPFLTGPMGYGYGPGAGYGYGMMGYPMWGGYGGASPYGYMMPGMMGWAYGPGPGSAGAGPHAMFGMMFALMDANGDGAISQEEFQAVAQRLFNYLDRNGDGRITPDELTQPNSGN